MMRFNVVRNISADFRALGSLRGWWIWCWHSVKCIVFYSFVVPKNFSPNCSSSTDPTEAWKRPRRQLTPGSIHPWPGLIRSETIAPFELHRFSEGRGFHDRYVHDATDSFRVDGCWNREKERETRTFASLQRSCQKQKPDCCPGLWRVWYLFPNVFPFFFPLVSPVK